MRLVVGLGNPGRAYADSRHNVGFRCVNYLARLYSIEMKGRQCQSQTGEGRMAGIDMLLAKPKTYVNRSGNAVRCLMQRHGIPVNALVVICDDLDLPLGRVRIRHRGSSGGHRGMESIISALGNQDFPRIKIGIGRPMGEAGSAITEEDAIVSYVLGAFAPEEEKVIQPAIAKVAVAVECIETEGVTAAMNRFNR